MMAPHFERARVLALAIDQANDLLQEPIDLIRIDGSEITVAAGGLMVTGTFSYHDAYAADGSPMPGSGHWSVELGEVHVSPRRT